jgi:hypothetical protein
MVLLAAGRVPAALDHLSGMAAPKEWFLGAWRLSARAEALLRTGQLPAAREALSAIDLARPIPLPGLAGAQRVDLELRLCEGLAASAASGPPRDLEHALLEGDLAAARAFGAQSARSLEWTLRAERVLVGTASARALAAEALVGAGAKGRLSDALTAHLLLLATARDDEARHERAARALAERTENPLDAVRVELYSALRLGKGSNRLARAASAIARLGYPRLAALLRDVGAAGGFLGRASALATPRRDGLAMMLARGAALDFALPDLRGKSGLLLHLGTCELFVAGGGADRSHSLRAMPRLWAVLLALARAGRPLSKEELFRAAWGLSYRGRGSDNALFLTVRRLRMALEADPEAPSFLLSTETGYSLQPGAFTLV